MRLIQAIQNRVFKLLIDRIDYDRDENGLRLDILVEN